MDPLDLEKFIDLNPHLADLLFKNLDLDLILVDLLNVHLHLDFKLLLGLDHAGVSVSAAINDVLSGADLNHKCSVLKVTQVEPLSQEVKAHFPRLDLFLKADNNG